MDWSNTRQYKSVYGWIWNGKKRKLWRNRNFSRRILKKLDEHENYPIHIITPRQILKAGIKESITEEDMEKTSQLFEDLKIKDEPIKSH